MSAIAVDTKLFAAGVVVEKSFVLMHHVQKRHLVPRPHGLQPGPHDALESVPGFPSIILLGLSSSIDPSFKDT